MGGQLSGAGCQAYDPSDASAVTSTATLPNVPDTVLATQFPGFILRQNFVVGGLGRAARGAQVAMK
jgi:hypothetical protein